MKSREGNEIPAYNAPIRIAVRVNSKSLCADCINILDDCKDLKRSYALQGSGYKRLISCECYEPVAREQKNNEGK